MWMSSKTKSSRSLRTIARCLPTYVVTALVISVILFFIIGEAGLPLAFPALFPQHSGMPTTVATDGVERWSSDARVTAPVFNLTAFNPGLLSVDPLFASAYQVYGPVATNTLGAPITAAFPSTHGWLQFFVNGALLLPSTGQAISSSSDAGDPLNSLMSNGVQDPTTHVLRLSLLQALLTVGSQLHVAGSNSSLTYVDLRKATAPNLMQPAPTSYTIDKNTHIGQIFIGKQGTFVQDGTRAGKVVGHLIPPSSGTFFPSRQRPLIPGNRILVSP